MSSDEMKRRRDFYADHPVDGELESMHMNLFNFPFSNHSDRKHTFPEGLN